MEKATLEAIAQRLDRLEKMVVEVNEKLSWLVEKLVSDTLNDCETTAVKRAAKAKNDEGDADIGAKVIEEILERMGYPPDFDPGTIEELHESMRQHGIRAEDNEFSRAIIAEREK